MKVMLCGEIIRIASQWIDRIDSYRSITKYLETHTHTLTGGTTQTPNRKVQWITGMLAEEMLK